MNKIHQTAEPSSLWECLHDGVAVSFASDLMARTLTVSVDAAYHNEFHSLPSNTILEVTGENVHVVEAFAFEAWPGAIEPPRETPWEIAEAQRQNNSKMGRLISTDWNAFIADVATEEEYIVMNATLTFSGQSAILELDVFSYPNSNYRTVRIQAECFHFFVGRQEMSLTEFQEFGAAYWNECAQRADARKKETNVQ